MARSPGAHHELLGGDEREVAVVGGDPVGRGVVARQLDLHAARRGTAYASSTSWG